MHALQVWIVAMLVPLCTAYAACKLMPSAARQLLVHALLRLPYLPRQLEAAMRRAAYAASGCSCDGCGHAAQGRHRNGPVPQPITFHPRAPR
jgi:hypothetical protein